MKLNVPIPESAALNEPFEARMVDNVLIIRLRKEPKNVASKVVPVDIVETADEIFVLANLVSFQTI